MVKDGSRARQILGAYICGPGRKNEKESDKGAKKELSRNNRRVRFAETIAKVARALVNFI